MSPGPNAFGGRPPFSNAPAKRRRRSKRAQQSTATDRRAAGKAGLLEEVQARIAGLLENVHGLGGLLADGAVGIDGFELQARFLRTHVTSWVVRL